MIQATDNTNAALRITQLGTGNALVVEDSANPDSTPFVVDASGNVGIGTSSPYTSLDVNGYSSFGVRNTTPYSTTATTHYFGSSPSDLIRNNIVFNINTDATTPARLRLYKSRGTSASPTTVNNGDLLGDIQFGGHDGTGYIYSGGMSMFVTAAPSTNSLSTALSFLTNNASNTGTERMRITSEGKVLIGATSPIPVGSTNGRTLEVLGTTFDTSGMALAGYNGIYGTLSLGASRGATVGSTSILLNGDQLGAIVFAGDDGTDLATQGASIVAEVDGTPGLNDMPGRLSFRTTADGASTPTERMRITSTGRMLVGTTTENTSGGVLQVSNGITFPATQSASADANTLDDYEEGTWTPTDASGAGLTLTINSAAYVKIGKMVYVTCSVTYPSTGSGAGAIIGGLPFTVESGIPTNGYWGGTTRYTTNSVMVMAATSPSTTTFAIYLGGGSQATNSYVSNLRYDFVFMYRATA